MKCSRCKAPDVGPCGLCADCLDDRFLETCKAQGVEPGAAHPDALRRLDALLANAPATRTDGAAA